MLRERWMAARFKQSLQSLIILFAIGGLVTLLAYFSSGSIGLVAVGVFLALLLLFQSRQRPQVVLQHYRAIPLFPRQLPDLQGLNRELARRAELPVVPKLYLLPSPTPNAFTVGGREKAAIALSEGLLQTLNLREIAGVLAHEISHLRHGDMRMLSLVDTLTRTLNSLSLVAGLLLIALFPFLVFGDSGGLTELLLVLIFAPALSGLLQLALSRSREYEADLSAIELTGDPAGLADALEKLERPRLRFWSYLFPLPSKDPGSALLRTHPVTRTRVERLRGLIPVSSREQRWSGSPVLFFH